MRRRELLKHLLLGMMAPVGALSPCVLANNASPVQPGVGKRLVLVELAGANDGLNTLVPFTNDHYHVLRPNIGLTSSAVLPITDDLGLHDSLRPLMSLWNDGELAWLQGLGYPQANRSHFTSIALWETAGDGLTSRGDRGWMTHAIEHRLARPVLDPHGISMAGDLDVFASDSGRWLSISSTAHLNSDKLPEDTVFSRGAIASQAATEPRHLVKALLQQRLQTLDNTLSRLQEKIHRSPEISGFAGGALAEQLRQVAQFIAAGVDTPVYRVRLNGFDTHQNQLQRHARLLSELSRSMAGFARTLKSLGEWKNTVIMTYSEFGRRAAENHSGGTDHGTAAPHMVLGGGVNGGLYATAPDLSELPDGDPDFTMDYRALYRAVLVDALGVQANVPHLAQFADQRLDGLFKRI